MITGNLAPPEITPELCRAARALAGISQEELARRARVARPTVADFERSARRPHRANLAAIRAALESAGVAFLRDGSIARTEPPRDAEGERGLAAMLRILQANAGALRRLGVRHLSLFGSVARGTAGAGSDVDLLIELDPRREMDLLDYAGIVGEIQALLPRPADVVRRDKLKAEIAAKALRDEIRVF
jgi:predicted nucleotidyltransferase